MIGPFRIISDYIKIIALKILMYWTAMNPAPYSPSPADATITFITTLPDITAPFSGVG